MKTGNELIGLGIVTRRIPRVKKQIHAAKLEKNISYVAMLSICMEGSISSLESVCTLVLAL